MPLRLLLLSNSTNPGEQFLGYPRPEIDRFLGSDRTVTFVPYAGVTLSWDEYADRVTEALGPIGVTIQSVHRTADPAALVAGSSAIMIGGGNTFNLLKELYANGLVDKIRARIQSGAKYIGWSAGSNVACPTIRTTNDMPIVEPPTLKALGLVPFQLNPHYTDLTIPNLRAETRDDRLKEFCLKNPDTYVAGLREGTMIEVNESMLRLIGAAPAKIFKLGKEPFEVAPGADVQFLLSSVPPK